MDVLADLLSGFVARHPRLQLAAEALEDAVRDVAEALGPRAFVTALRVVDGTADVVAGAIRAAHHLATLDAWVAHVAEAYARLALLETTHQLTTRRLADLDRRLREIEAGFDRGAS